MRDRATATTRAGGHRVRGLGALRGAPATRTPAGKPFDAAAARTRLGQLAGDDKVSAHPATAKAAAPVGDVGATPAQSGAHSARTTATTATATPDPPGHGAVPTARPQAAARPGPVGLELVDLRSGPATPGQVRLEVPVGATLALDLLNRGGSPVRVALIERGPDGTHTVLLPAAGGAFDLPASARLRLPDACAAAAPLGGLPLLPDRDDRSVGSLARAERRRPPRCHASAAPRACQRIGRRIGQRIGQSARHGDAIARHRSGGPDHRHAVVHAGRAPAPLHLPTPQGPIRPAFAR